jgi:hypothetical protein
MRLFLNLEKVLRDLELHYIPNGGAHFIARLFKETKIATRSCNITKKSL